MISSRTLIKGTRSYLTAKALSGRSNLSPSGSTTVSLLLSHTQLSRLLRKRPCSRAFWTRWPTFALSKIHETYSTKRQAATNMMCQMLLVKASKRMSKSHLGNGSTSRTGRWPLFWWWRTTSWPTPTRKISWSATAAALDQGTVSFNEQVNLCHSLPWPIRTWRAPASPRKDPLKRSSWVGAWWSMTCQDKWNLQISTSQASESKTNLKL